MKRLKQKSETFDLASLSISIKERIEISILKDHLPIETIVKCVGLSKDEMRQLQIRMITIISEYFV